MKRCDDGDVVCVHNWLCGCNGLCPDFKTEMGCKEDGQGLLEGGSKEDTNYTAEVNSLVEGRSTHGDSVRRLINRRTSESAEKTLDKTITQKKCQR